MHDHCYACDAILPIKTQPSRRQQNALDKLDELRRADPRGGYELRVPIVRVCAACGAENATNSYRVFH